MYQSSHWSVRLPEMAVTVIGAFSICHVCQDPQDCSIFFHDLSAWPACCLPCSILKQPNSKFLCRPALGICAILLEHNCAMRALQFSGVCYYFFLAILMSQSWAALMVDQGCQNVPGAGDMTDTINNQMFALSIEMALYARQTLEDFIYRPQGVTDANRERVTNLLAAAALPTSHASFRRAVDGIIGGFPQTLS